MGYSHKKSLIEKIIYFIILAVLIFVGIKIYGIYKVNNFNNYVKSEYNSGYSKFTRDENIKYSKQDSYKITNEQFNDAMFYKVVSVKKNTPYKVTCYVKTKNVENEKQVSNGGAHISISDTVEKSESITGTTEWTKLEFMFNSKNRDTVDLGFRLGGYGDNCKGEAWFSDFTIESGIANTSDEWNFACFLIDNINVTLNNGKKVNVSLTSDDIKDMKDNMSRFKDSCRSLSGNNMTVKYDIIEIKEPLTSLSYDEENEYFIAAENAENLIKEYINKKEYDHIFICVRMGDINTKTEIPTHDWIGLGGMDYYGIGFSNIRLPNNSQNYIYKYDTRINTFPEEVFVHEFIHSLERNAKEYGYTIPALHDYSKYGYTEEKLEGLEKWYGDYMTGNIKDSTGNKIGLDKAVYKFKPVNSSNFEFTYKLNSFDEPKNELEGIINNLKNVFSR